MTEWLVALAFLAVLLGVAFLLERRARQRPPVLNPTVDLRNDIGFGILAYLGGDPRPSDEQLAYWADRLRAEGEDPHRFEVLARRSYLDFLAAKKGTRPEQLRAIADLPWLFPATPS